MLHRSQNIGDQLLLVFEILSCLHVPPHTPVHDHLAAHITGGLQQDRIHIDGGLCPCRLCLHHLCASHFQSLTGYEGIQSHILRLKGCDPEPLLVKQAAESRCHKALSGI